MARRPWLLTQAGQKLSLLLVFAVSLLAISPAINQVSEDNQRQVSQLDPEDVTYCELSACEAIEKLAGLQVTEDIEVSEASYGTQIRIRLINTGRLTGVREVWSQIRTEEGKLVEAIRARLELSDQGPQHVEFQFSGKPSELANLRVFLGF